jgi:pimeloyl-ACP methyl ester carboxylesterase
MVDRNRKQLGVLIAGLLAAVIVWPGCQQPHPPADAPPDSHGLVWILPGISGGAWCMGSARRAFRDAGVVADIRINEWDRPLLDSLGHLQNYEKNRALAARVAEQTAAHWDAHPGAPIDLVGYSAGGGIALMVAEALPERVRLRHVILVQAGVSPTWDLTATLERIDGRLVSFYCPTDWLILGWGTEVFGTVDRKNVASAGKNGFDLDKAAADPDLRAKVVEQRWGRDMMGSGHLGNHTAILLYSWNKRYIAPWLLGGVVARGTPATAPSGRPDPAP